MLRSIEKPPKDERDQTGLATPSSARKWPAGPALLHCGLTLAACAAAAGLHWWLGRTIGELPPFLTFYPAVVLAALFGGTTAGICATVLSLLAVFFLEPHGPFGVPSAADIVSMLLFGAINVGISIVAGRLRAKRRAGMSAKRILEQTGEAFFHVDSRERFTYVNAQAERLLSRRRAELIGRRVWECFAPAVDAGFQRIYRGAAAERAAHHFEALCRPTGTWFDVNAHPANGGLAVFFSDITARKQAEDALRESEEKFRTLAENMATAAGIVQGTRFVYVNHRMAELLGYTVAELLTMHFPELVHPQHREMMIERAQRRQMGAPVPSHYEFIALTKSGEERWFDFWPALITYQGKPAIIGTGLDITERKRAEEALRQSERFIKSVAEASPNCFYVFDLDRMGVSYMNRSIMADLGYPPELQTSALELQAFRTFMPREEEPHVERLLHEWRALADGSVRDDEYRLRAADGSWRYFAGREIVFARRDDGTVRQILGSLTDITPRKQAEEELRRAAERFRIMGEVLPYGVWWCNERGESEYLSQSCLDLLQMTLEEQQHFGWAKRLPPDEVEPMIRRWTHCIETGADWDYEHHVLGPDEKYHTVLTRGRPVRDRSGKIVGWAGINLDIDERKRIEQERRRSEEVLRQALDAAQLGTWQFDPQTGRMIWDERSQAILGCRAPETSEQAMQCVHPDDLAGLAAAFHGALHPHAEGVFTHEFRAIHSDGALRWAQADGKVIFAGAGEHRRPLRMVGTMADITQQKQADQALRESEEKAERAKAAAEQASRAKDHFLAVLSHELRTPLTPVLAGLSILGSEGAFNAHAQEIVEMIHRNVEMEARLIDDLLDVTRIARGKIEMDRKPIALCEVLRRAVEVCKPDLQARGLVFELQLQGAPYIVLADIARLQQVFWNLLRNAIKFTPHGGRVSVHGRQSNGTIVVEVSDTGIGIEPDMLPRLFNAFEQAERSITRQFGGLGLGLTISKSLVEMHGGRIEAQSAGKGQGATFRVSLPAFSPVPAELLSPPTPADPVAAAPRPSRILLVEDHVDTARTMCAALKADGHEVETAADVSAALELADRGDFDLLISDLGLPDASGLDLMRELRRRGNPIPGIALSGYGQDEDVRRSREAGFAAHLIKPASLARLAEAIAAIAG